MGARMQQLRVGIGKWMTISLAINASSLALVFGVVAVAFGVPTRALLLPYSLQLLANLIFVASIYWAWKAPDRPKVSAARAAVGVYVPVVTMVLLMTVGLVKAGILSWRDAVGFIIPSVAFGGALVSMVLYKTILRRLRKNSSSGGASSQRS